MKITNQTRKTIIADKAKRADTFLSRMIGLLNRKGLTVGEALIITRCQSIHMFFMRFSIDVIFVNKNNRVVSILRSFPPNRLSPLFYEANFVIECPVGIIEESKTQIGDVIEISL